MSTAQETPGALTVSALLEHVLRLVAGHDDLQALLHDVTQYLQTWTGCEAVGIRLRDGDDFPYFVTRGFPAEFVALENTLCEYCPDGTVACDEQGHPCLACMCGSILRGRTDPTLPFFTTRGSFWSNHTTALLATTTEEQRQARTRNRCNSEGYESVALIPLRVGADILGLLQLNDHAQDRFTPEMLATLEQLADHLAVALSQRAAIQACQQSEQRIASIFRAAPVGIGVVVNRILQEVNERLCEMTGYAREELLGQSSRLLYPTQDDFEYVGREKYRQIDAHGVGTLETRWQRKDGTLLDVQLSSSPIDPDDLAAGVTFTALDITARKQADVTLREQEELFRTVADWTMDWEMWLAPDGALRYISPSVEQMTGYPVSAFLADPSLLHAIVFPEDRERWLEHADRYLTSYEQTAELEYRVITRDGAVRWVYHRCRPVFDHAGVFLGRRISNRDITGRKQARERMQRQALVLDQISDGVIITDLDGVITYVNDANCRMLGRAREELVGHPIAILGEDPTRGASQQVVLAQTLEQGEWHGTVVNFAADGTEIILDCRTQLVNDAQGKPVALCGISTDITTRSRAEELLRTQRNLAMALGQSTNLEESLRYSVLAAMQATGMDCGGVYLVNQETGEMELTFHTGLSDAFIAENRVYALDDPHTRFIMAGQAQYWTGASLPAIGLDLVSIEGLRTLAVIPIHHEGRVVGSLNLASHTQHGVPDYVQGTLETMANQIGEAIVRNQVQAALRESEARYRAFIEHAAEAVGVVQHGRFQFINARAEAMTGYTVDELLALTLADIVHPDDLDYVLDMHARRLRGEAVPEPYRIRIVRKDDGISWVEIQGSVINWRGAPATLNLYTEVTERQLAEIRRRIEHARTRTLLDMYARAAQMTDQQLLEYVLEQAVALSDSEIGFLHLVSEDGQTVDLTVWDQATRQYCTVEYPPHNLAERGGIWAECLRTRQPAICNDYPNYPQRCGLPPGHAPVQRVMGVPVLHHGAHICVILAVGNKPEDYDDSDVIQLQFLGNELHKIMVQRRAEAALHESEARWQFALEGSGDGVWDWAIATDQVYFSPQWKAMLGYAEAEVPNTLEEWESRIDPDDREAVLAALTQHFTGQTDIYVSEHRLRCKDGSEKWILDRGKVIARDADGQPLRMIGTHTDISERKQAECALRESEERYRRLFSEMMSGFALHQILCDETGAAVDYTTLEVNQAFETLLGAPREAIIGRRASEILSPDELRDWLAIFGPVALTGASTRYDYCSPVTGRCFGGVAYSPQPRQFAVIFSDITERKRAEAALRESEERYRSIFMSAAAGMVEVSLDGRLRQVNHAFARFLGYAEADLIGRTVMEITHPDDRESSAEAIREMLAGQAVNQQFEKRYLRADGTVLWGEVSLAAVRQPDGTPINLTAQVLDITERKRAEQALRESEEKFNRAFRVSPDAININRLHDGVYLEINEGFTALTGYTAADAIGRSSLSGELGLWVREDDRQRLVAGLRAHGEVVGLEAPFRCKDGTIRDCLMSARVIEIQGEPCILSITRDISDRIRTEVALRESETRFRTIVEHVNDAFIMHDFDGMILDANDNASRLYGGPPERIIGTNLRDTSTPENAILVAERMAQLMQNGSLTFDADKLLRDGTRVPVSVSARVISREGRGIVHSFTRDMSERQRLEAQLRQAQKMESIGRLAGGVAHDFNNMLMVILNAAEGVLGEMPADSPHHEEVQEIRKAAQRSAELTRQLLAFARKQTICPQPLELNQAVAGMLTMLRRLIGEGINLAWHPGFNTWTVCMDPSQLDQLLANLAVNARDAIAGLGEVGLDTANVTLDAAIAERHGVAPGDYVQLTVRDTGCGIAPDVLPLIFDPFYTTKGLESGTGLGLATVYGIVTQNGGAIAVESTVGAGTTFHIFLPRYHDAVEPAAPAPVAAPVITGPETVLMVEDEEAILRVGRLVLERLGYTVLTANRPHQALEMAADYAEPIHLLITDMVMPEMNGWELSQRILELRPALKCLFMSGYTADIALPDNALHDGTRFLQKPFTMTTLAERVRLVLDDADAGG